MNKIEVCIIGNDNVGKTTLASVLSNKKVGIISRKKSTMKPTIIAFSDKEKETEYYDDYDKVYTDSKTYDRELELTFIDSAYYKKDMFLSYDFIINVIDITNYNEDIKYEDHPLVVNVVNKFDYDDDTELNLFYDEICDKLNDDDVIKISAGSIYTLLFEDSMKKKSIEKMYNSKEEALRKLGYYNLFDTINSYIKCNIDGIFENRMERLNNMDKYNISIKDVVLLYDNCSKVKNLDKPLSKYIENIIHNLNNDICDEDSNDEGDEDNLDNENIKDEEDEDEGDEDEEEDEEEEEEDGEDDNKEDNKEENIEAFVGIREVLQRFDSKLLKEIILCYHNSNTKIDLELYISLFSNQNKYCNTYTVLYLLKRMCNDLADDEIVMLNNDMLDKLLSNIDHEFNNNIKNLGENYLYSLMTYIFNKLEGYKKKEHILLQKDYIMNWIWINNIVKKYSFDDNFAYITITNNSTKRLMNKMILERKINTNTFNRLGCLLKFITDLNI